MLPSRFFRSPNAERPDTIDVDPVVEPSYNVSPALGPVYTCVPLTDTHPEQAGDPAQRPIAQDTLLRSNGRPVITRFFGKSVRTGKKMHSSPILPLLRMLTLAASVAGVAGQLAGAEIDPPALLEAAQRALQSRGAIAAQVRHEVHLFDKDLAGFGSYLEHRQGLAHRVRMELRIQLGDQTSTFLQVCDGDFVWTYRRLRDDARLSRIDVGRVKRALQKAQRTSNHRQMAGTDLLPSLGGLPRLLQGLQDSFDFTRAEPAQLGKQKRPVWKLHGRWKTEQLVKLLPGQEASLRQGRPADLSKLPLHPPDRVILSLGQEDGFPYRVDYRRTGTDGSRALVTMELFDVHYPRDVDLRHFVYNPGDLEYSDRTDGYLESLGVEEAK